MPPITEASIIDHVIFIRVTWSIMEASMIIASRHYRSLPSYYRPITVHYRPLPFITVYYRLLPSITVHYRPLPFITVQKLSLFVSKTHKHRFSIYKI